MWRTFPWAKPNLLFQSVGGISGKWAEGAGPGNFLSWNLYSEEVKIALALQVKDYDKIVAGPCTCSQVACVGSPEAGLDWGMSPSQGGPGLPSCAKAAFFLWLCKTCSPRRPPEGAEPLVACLVLAFPFPPIFLAAGQQGNSFISSPMAWR